MEVIAEYKSAQCVECGAIYAIKTLKDDVKLGGPQLGSGEFSRKL